MRLGSHGNARLESQRITNESCHSKVVRVVEICFATTQFVQPHAETLSSRYHRKEGLPIPLLRVVTIVGACSGIAKRGSASFSRCHSPQKQTLRVYYRILPHEIRSRHQHPPPLRA